MPNERRLFEIQSSRLTRYFRIRWCLPMAMVTSLGTLTLLGGADGDFRHPAVLVSLAFLIAFVVAPLVIAPVYVRALEYWIDGSTLRINEGIVVRKSKSIPLDRVTDIELVHGPLMRMCGISSLRIQTAGSTQQSPEGTIWGVRDPETIRDEIVTVRDRAASKSNSSG